MSDTVIKVENLGKKYLIRHQQSERYTALRDVLTNKFKCYGKRLLSLQPHSSNLQPSEEEFWALKDVSFEVKKGDRLGVIGRNGAGKTTLLKLLSRITEPTTGRIAIKGRVASLLEVGTGFHPELTGRENIFLNGAILGMAKAEIRKKFDEIVNFAEIEKFLDTPVKRYSSGMYVRLAFAVAAHLEPEILLVDEVLAVGDIGFQRKCLGKISKETNGGRTVLFVSHQMNQIRRLCEKTIWLDFGRVRERGVTSEVVSAYETSITSISLEAVNKKDDEHSTARFIRWEIVNPQNDRSNVLTVIGPVTVRFIVKIRKLIKNGHHGVALFNSDNQLMWATAINDLQIETGIYAFVYNLPTLPIRPGVYHWQVSLYDENDLLDVWFGVPEMIIATEPTGHHLDVWQGVLNLPCEFSVKKE